MEAFRKCGISAPSQNLFIAAIAPVKMYSGNVWFGDPHNLTEDGADFASSLNAPIFLADSAIFSYEGQLTQI